MKSLDAKIAEIRKDPSGSKAFIIADAKDADMAFGITAPGQKRPLNPERVLKSEIHWKTLEEYRRQIRDVVRQGLVDIMLMSASNVEQLAMRERLFENSHVTPAARANDATDIWVIRGASYIKEPSRPFRSATLDHIKCGEIECDPGATTTGADLGLYSVTFNHNFERDFETLRAFKEFREEAERKNFRYFLEVFDPNVDTGIAPGALDGFINDHIIRSLAGVTQKGRPLFLKIAWRGPRAMEELVAYDPQLIVGILGGSAGTTFDAFKLIAEAQKHGARVALFGRKINHAENPLAFIEFLRRIVEREITPEEAVKAYHGVLEKLGVAPHRALADDLQPSSGATSYGGSGGSRTTIVKPDGTPAAKPETSRVAEQLARIRQRFGE
ncbi:MAG TPA: hypothetical protein VEO95_00035 [Chthoniobacteraceae bacterium]|nr:hypothetical protein [Chthoniobacteraceae bacterium]